MILYLTFPHKRGALISLSISFLLFVQVLQAAAQTPNLQAIKANCTGESYAQNSPFAANLDKLLSSLVRTSASSISANVTVIPNTAAGSSSDSTYGLFMCQGDIASSDCRSCVSAAAAAIVNSCKASRQAVIWYDRCELRYSDVDFFGIPNTNGFHMQNPYENTSSSRPLAVVTDLVNSAPQQPLRFASKALIDESLYALAQCTVDLSTDDCNKCLTTILADIRGCCTEYKGWRYLANSCWVRYEATPFLNLDGTYTELTSENCSISTFSTNNLVIMESNVDKLLSNLALEAQPTGFFKTTIGESMDQLYGLALCRGDLIPPSADCDQCLQNASKTITGDCPNSTEGIKWYEKCLMRYSTQNFFGVVDLSGRSFCGVDKIGQASSDATFKLAAGLVGMAANNPLMVAAGQQPSRYVLLQCTRDLSSDGCSQCLETGLKAVGAQCNQTNGWRYLSRSCILRYEVFPFFNASAITSSEPQAPVPPPKEQRKKKVSDAIIAAIIASVLGVAFLGLLYYLWHRRRTNAIRRGHYRNLSADWDLPLVDLALIQGATNNFSDENKLGEGGFGPVYRGIMHGEKEIAVKRLSKKSKQGAAEFKNEVKLIAKLQHRNLVKMLGCCIEREEKLIIYEFLPNKSLDFFLFDPDKRAKLDWNRRVRIISGIARGLLYLHEDSRLKVIHRDLKASNVLLDNEMNPKISDFGMAKIFEADESATNEANTNRIVGTYGYMAPEYAMDGFFSVKSDVYSFGVLLLEIISGEKNGRSHYERYGQTLLRHAWQLWNEDKATELMDPLLEGSYPTNEAMKCMHIGLLCVQESPTERPTMFAVVQMLQGDLMPAPPPTQPPTFVRQQIAASDSSTDTHSVNNAYSVNQMTDTITLVR